MPYRSASAVIPTYNRRASLARTLTGLQQQEPASASLEVVVVDDGSTDDTAQWLEQQKFSFPVRLLRQQNAGPAAARNAGLQAASGELILFLDDDLEPTPALLREHLATHGDDRARVVLGTLSSLPHYPQPWVAWEQRQVEKQYAAMIRGDWAPTFRQFWTGNASVSREHLVATGGFDVEFKRAEDVELGVRLHQRGLTFHFNPRAKGLHHARRSLDSFCELQRQYGRREVEIFTRADGDPVPTLRGNWWRLKPATRALVARTTKSAAARAACVASLRGLLRVCELAGANGFAQGPCSALANVLFWGEAAGALGPARCALIGLPVSGG